MYINEGAAAFNSGVQSNVFRGGDTVKWLAYAPNATANTKKGFVFAAAEIGNHFSEQQIDLLFQGTGTNRPEFLPEAGARVLAGELNGDTFVDFILVPASGNIDVQIYKNASDASIGFQAAINRTPTTAIQDSTLVNLVGDANLDLLLATSAGVELYENKGNFSFTVNATLTPTSLSVSATRIIATDLTYDGTVDLFMSRSGSTSVFYSQTGTLTFSDITSTAFGSSSLTSGPIKIYAADIDSDNVLDIVELFSTGAVTVHINQFESN